MYMTKLNAELKADLLALGSIDVDESVLSKIFSSASALVLWK